MASVDSKTSILRIFVNISRSDWVSFKALKIEPRFFVSYSWDPLSIMNLGSSLTSLSFPCRFKHENLWRWTVGNTANMNTKNMLFGVKCVLTAGGSCLGHHNWHLWKITNSCLPKVLYPSAIESVNLCSIFRYIFMFRSTEISLALSASFEDYLYHHRSLRKQKNKHRNLFDQWLPERVPKLDLKSSSLQHLDSWNLPVKLPLPSYQPATTI